MTPKLYYVLDAEHRPVPVSLEAWADFFANLDVRRVAYTEIGKGVEVSTVFLGLDHNHSGRGPPLLFETLIFGGPLDQQMWRYSSWDNATIGHEAAVKKVRKALNE